MGIPPMPTIAVNWSGQRGGWRRRVLEERQLVERSDALHVRGSVWHGLVSRALVQLTLPTTDVEAFGRLHDPAAAGLRAHVWQHRRPFFLVRMRAPQSILGMLPLDLFELVLTEFIGTGYVASAYVAEAAVA